jgi:putative PIN family toxin of toxin-antitoxin system
MSQLRVVLDTNVLVSGVAFPFSIPGRIVALWKEGGLDVVLSRYIANEMVRVLPRMPQNRRSPEQLLQLAELFLSLADVVEPDAFTDSRLRDPADQPILATWHMSKADYLITGDKDLLALANEYPIVTPAEFWLRHG